MIYYVYRVSTNPMHQKKEVKQLGSVQVDIYKKEKEYKHLTLSDENVVKYLILYRSSVDVSYGANVNVNINQAGDMFDFNQELICLYASLDNLIKRLELKDKEKELIDLVFSGNTISDVVNSYGYARKTAYRIFNKVIDKVVKLNYEDWSYTVKRKINNQEKSQ